MKRNNCEKPSRFLSTPSARRATVVGDQLFIATAISIHALREEGDDAAKAFLSIHIISIHALREEGDSGDFVLPWRPNISIHALREEGDTGRGQMAK